MLKNKKLLLAAVAALLAGAGAARAQGLGNSPYSRLGLGELNPNTGGVRHLGLGGVGVAAPNAVYVNELNPALLYYTSRTTWEAAFNGQVKTVQNSTTSLRTGTGTLAYLALAVPLSKNWGAALGLKPFSAVDYKITSIQPVINDPTATAFTQDQGTGGLSEVYFAQGYHILRDLSVGATASYVFGTIDQTSGTVVVPQGVTVREQAVNRDQVRYSDFTFRAAAHYRHKVGKSLSANVAAVQTFQTELNGQRTRSTERQDGNGAVLGQPTVNGSDEGTATVPALTQLGLSLDNDKNWALSLDVARQQWSNFRSFSQTATALLDNTLRVALGGELTPDPGSVQRYLKRVTYRAGISLAQMPFRPDGQTLYDRAVHWGFGFPLPTATPLEATTLSLGFAYGVRGNTEFGAGNRTSNVREDYLRVQVGATLNNRWFLKRRLQ